MSSIPKPPTFTPPKQPGYNAATQVRQEKVLATPAMQEQHANMQATKSIAAKLLTRLQARDKP